MKLSEISKQVTQRVLIYGPPKSGKSQLAGTLSQKFNLLWFDLEKGYAVLTKLPHEQQERIELIALPDTRTYPIAIETMGKLFKQSSWPYLLCNKHGKVNCALCKKDNEPVTSIDLYSLDSSWIVVVDSLTQLANSAMAYITRGQDDEYKYDWDDYRKQGTVMDKFLTACQQAPFNLVCITHEAEAELEDGSKKLVPVAGTLNFSRNTAKYFDHVIYASVKNRQHKFASSSVYGIGLTTGSRTDFEIEGQDTANLVAIFTGEYIPATKSEVKKEEEIKSVQVNKSASDALEKARAKLAAIKK